jgi:hypothetical protein
MFFVLWFPGGAGWWFGFSYKTLKPHPSVPLQPRAAIALAVAQGEGNFISLLPNIVYTFNCCYLFSIGLTPAYRSPAAKAFGDGTQAGFRPSPCFARFQPDRNNRGKLLPVSI